MTHEAVTYELGGRRLVARGSVTFQQRLWLLQTARHCGLTDLAMALEAGSVDDATVENALWRAVHPEFGLRLMAGLLVEEGQRWTIEGAGDLLAWLRQLDEPAVVEHAELLLIDLLKQFFTAPRETQPPAPTSEAAA